jgi:hypothetical protein
MRISLGFITALAAGAAAAAVPYPTADRVEYVLECMRSNGGEYAYLYKCSCAIDAIAASLPYEEYVEAAAVARYQGMGGERMGIFREPESVQALAKRYRAVQAEAKRSCQVER